MGGGSSTNKNAVQQALSATNNPSQLNQSKYNWKASTIEPPSKSSMGTQQVQNQPSSSLKMYQDAQRPNSINKNVIGGGNFQTLDPVDIMNYNNKQRIFNSTIQQFAQILPDPKSTIISNQTNNSTISTQQQQQKESSRRGKTPSTLEIGSPEIINSKKGNSTLNMTTIIQNLPSSTTA